MSEVIVSGMRPSGAVHLGHYVGVIKNWIELQKKYKCFFFVADWHALTSLYAETEVIKKARYDYVKGWIACGVDINKVTIYNQSAIPEILMLSQIFLSLTPPGWADRSPSWKDQTQNPQKKLDNLGFYTYPILQAADIALPGGTLVPVGEDQVSHIEISREIIRKFNRLYNTKLKEPQAALRPVSKLLGLDGKKMSSSIGNVISLNETEKSLQKKINRLKTDDLRKGIESPGNPDNCTAFSYHKIFSKKDKIEAVSFECKNATLGCGQCKLRLGESMKEEMMPIAEKFNNISDKDCDEILHNGTIKMKNRLEKTFADIMKKIKFN